MSPTARNGGILRGCAPRGRIAARLAAVAVLLGLAGCASLEACGIEGCQDDRRISGEVRALLEGHAALETPNRVTVQTVNRVVYLNGLVDTPYERELAEALAHQAHGAVRVVNSIGVDNGPR
jgi:osmotically-inducible protein OsmY